MTNSPGIEMMEPSPRSPSPEPGRVKARTAHSIADSEDSPSPRSPSKIAVKALGPRCFRKTVPPPSSLLEEPTPRSPMIVNDRIGKAPAAAKESLSLKPFLKSFFSANRNENGKLPLKKPKIPPLPKVFESFPDQDDSEIIFNLHTRSKWFTPAPLKIDQKLSPSESDFHHQKPIKLVVGPLVGGVPAWWERLRDALLEYEDVNLIHVTGNTKNVNAQALAKQILDLVGNYEQQETPPRKNPVESMHMIAVGWGVQVCSFVGKFSDGRLAQITAFNPKPRWTTEDEDEASKNHSQLDRTDAQFVEVISSLPDREDQGHLNFYINSDRLDAEDPSPIRVYIESFKKRSSPSSSSIAYSCPGSFDHFATGKWAWCFLGKVGGDGASKCALLGPRSVEWKNRMVHHQKVFGFHQVCARMFMNTLSEEPFFGEF